MEKERMESSSTSSPTTKVATNNNASLGSSSSSAPATTKRKEKTARRGSLVSKVASVGGVVGTGSKSPVVGDAVRWSPVEMEGDDIKASSTARSGHAAFEDEIGRLFLVGGNTGTRLDISALRLSEGESGAALTGSMVKLEVAEETRDLPERFGFAHAYCEREKVLFMHGGFDREYNHSGTRFLVPNSSPSPDSPPLFVRQLEADLDRGGPSPRGYHSAVYVDQSPASSPSYVYTFGGQCCEGGPYAFLSDVHRLRLSDLRWERVECTGDSPSPRSQCLAFKRGGYIVVYGGYDGRSIMTDLHRLDLSTHRWERLRATGEAPLGLKGLSPLDFHIYFCKPSGVVIGKRLLLLAEDYERSTAAAYTLNLNTHEWTRLRGTSGRLKRTTGGGGVSLHHRRKPDAIKFDPPARGSPTLSMTGGHLLLVGGHPRDPDSGDPEGRVWRMEPPRCLGWEEERLLWIGCLKNDPAECPLARIPPHVIYKILGFANARTFYLK